MVVVHNKLKPKRRLPCAASLWQVWSWADATSVQHIGQSTGSSNGWPLSEAQVRLLEDPGGIVVGIDEAVGAMG